MNDTAVDLGRYDAQTRVIRFVLRVVNRLLARGQTFDVPLRQTHIADATGITRVHVSNVLGEFRRSGVIALADRSLKIQDLAKLQRLAEQ